MDMGGLLGQQGAQAVVAQDIGLGLFVQGQGGDQGHDPVSYTHLDVYKRQGVKNKTLRTSQVSDSYLHFPSWSSNAVDAAGLVRLDSSKSRISVAARQRAIGTGHLSR